MSRGCFSFQSMSLCDGQPIAKNDSSNSSTFQSTPPHGGRRELLFKFTPTILFQSTPPHGGRLQNPQPIAGLMYVSIHAPTRGATRRGVCPARAPGWFQSTPPHGGRLLKSVILLLSLKVSIHAPTRGRRAVCVHIFAIFVSIHAPTRGRQSRTRSPMVTAGFNPRPHTGATYQMQ